MSTGPLQCTVVPFSVDLTGMWEDWAGRVQIALDHIEFILSPDLIIIGGGVSRPERWDEFGHLLDTKAKLVPAALTNEAGIVGAAWRARKAKD